MRKIRQLGEYLFLISAVAILLSASACTRQKVEDGSGKLRIVTTIFPLYDYARVIGGDRVKVDLLLPPGVETHSFEPRPEDIARIGKADLFIFTNAEMEPWADKLSRIAASNGKPLKLEAGEKAAYLTVSGTGADDGHGHGADGHHSRDPHIWLNIANAKVMVKSIADGMAACLPAEKELFAANASAYMKRLDDLENRYRSGLSSCRTREFIHGGHYAFAYLAERYNLKYISAYGITAESEPSPRRMMELVKSVRSHGLKYIFFEELLAPRVAETISAETGASLLKLHGIHNLTKDELVGGATYIGLMEQNLANLRKGLECR